MSFSVKDEPVRTTANQRDRYLSSPKPPSWWGASYHVGVWRSVASNEARQLVRKAVRLGTN